MKKNKKKNVGLIMGRLLIQTVAVTIAFCIIAILFYEYDYRKWIEGYVDTIERINNHLISSIQEMDLSDDSVGDLLNRERLLLGSNANSFVNGQFYARIMDRDNNEIVTDSKQRAYFTMPDQGGQNITDDDNSVYHFTIYSNDDEQFLDWMDSTKEEFYDICAVEDQPYLFFQVNKFIAEDEEFQPVDIIAYYKGDYHFDVSLGENDYETWSPEYTTMSVGVDDKDKVMVNSNLDSGVYVVGSVNDASDYIPVGTGDSKHYITTTGTYNDGSDSLYYEYNRSFFKGDFLCIVKEPFRGTQYSVDDNRFEISLNNYTMECYFKANYWEERGKGLLPAILIIYGIVFVINAVISVILSISLIVRRREADFRRVLMDSISHDLKSPLTALRGYAESLKENLNEEKKEAYADAILESTDYMDRLINGNLELLRLQDKRFAGNKEKTDLVKMTENLFEKYTPSLEERNITLTVKGDYIKKVNKNLFANALENLVSNSVKYVDDGGEINVVGNKNYFTILNSVEELPDKKGEELWETFVKGNDSRSNEKGSGIGMAIAKSIFDIHKIKASIDYEDGEKKKFGVYIY